MLAKPMKNRTGSIGSACAAVGALWQDRIAPQPGHARELIGPGHHPAITPSDLHRQRIGLVGRCGKTALTTPAPDALKKSASVACRRDADF